MSYYSLLLFTLLFLAFTPVKSVIKGAKWINEDQSTSGQPTSLTCDVEGKPEATVQWSRLHSNNTKSYIAVGGVLVWVELQPARDNGIYRCHAANQFTNHSSLAVGML